LPQKTLAAGPMMMTLPETRYRKSAGDEPLPGYRLISPLGRGGFGEVWKCLAPGGLQKAVKFVCENEDDQSTPLRQEYEAFLRMKGIRHPFLLMLERVELLGGELIMVMELADQSLEQRYQECRNQGRDGIPRSELLSYMIDAAEALDVLSRQHKLQHLDVKPANLFLVGGHVKVGDYGLVGRVETGNTTEGKHVRGLTPKYVAPEVLQNQIDVRSDQYTLALVYQELLSGKYAYKGTTAEEVLFQHVHGTPDLSSMIAGDRTALRKALSKRPSDRFATCLDFVKALLSAELDTPPPKDVEPAAAKTTIIGLNQTQMYHRGTAETLSSRTAAPLNATVSGFSASGMYGPSVTLRIGGGPNEELSRAFPGYRFLAEVEQGPRGRVIRAADPMNRNHLIHFVRGGNGHDLEAVLRAALTPSPAVVQTIAVPQSRVYVFAVPEDWIPLRQRDVQRKAASEPWKRHEIVELLKPIAAGLDELHARCGFPHAFLSPQTIVTKGARTAMTGYGMAEMLRRTQTELDWISNDPYAAPEAQAGKPTTASDQYSLALVFVELMDAWKPKDLRGQRRNDSITIQLDKLLEREIQAVRRATTAAVGERFATCAEFIAALGESKHHDGVVLEDVRPIESTARLLGRTDHADPPNPEDYLRGLLQLLPAPTTGRTAAEAVKQADHRWAFRFPVLLNSDMIRMKLDSYREERRCEAVVVNNETLTFRTATKLGKPGVELTVVLPGGTNSHAAELLILGRTTGGLDAGSRTISPALVEAFEQLKRSLQPQDDRRWHPRTRIDWPAVVYSVNDGLQVGPAIPVKLCDFSAGGASFVPSAPVPPGHVFLSFPDKPAHEWVILCRVVRTGDVVSVAYVAN